MSMSWSGALISGNPIIDFQHKLALEMVKKLLDDYQNGANRYTLEEAITFFDCYILEHFGDEEDVISRHRLPGLDKHALEHKQMARDFYEFKEKAARNGFSRSITSELLAGLSACLATHFKKTDRSLIFTLKKIYTPEKKIKSLATKIVRS